MDPPRRAAAGVDRGWMDNGMALLLRLQGEVSDATPKSFIRPPTPAELPPDVAEGEIRGAPPPAMEWTEALRQRHHQGVVGCEARLGAAAGRRAGALSAQQGRTRALSKVVISER